VCVCVCVCVCVWARSCVCIKILLRNIFRVLWHNFRPNLSVTMFRIHSEVRWNKVALLMKYVEVITDIFSVDMRPQPKNDVGMTQ
jgi:hypothetical protein